MANMLTKYLSSHSKLIFSIVVFAVFSVLFTFTDVGRAHAVNLLGIPSDIRSRMQGFDNYGDSFPGQGNINTNCPEAGTQSNSLSEFWLWYQNSQTDGSPSAPINVTPGQNININIQTMDFLCHMATSLNEQYDGGTSNSADSSPNTVFGAPNTYILSAPGATNRNDGTQTGCTGGDGNWPWCGDGFARVSQFDFSSPQISQLSGPGYPNNAGSLSSSINGTGVGGGQYQDICFQPGTRYWYPGYNNLNLLSIYACSYGNQTSTLSYTAPSQPGIYEIQVSINITAASWFTINGGSNECLAHGGSYIPDGLTNGGSGNELSDTGLCPAYPATFNIQINDQYAWQNNPILYNGSPTTSPTCPSSNSNGNVVYRGDALNFTAGMCNTGSGNSPATAIEFYPSQGVGDVVCPSGALCSSGNAPSSTDPQLIDSGYDGFCMANGASSSPSCFFGNGVQHYWWIRSQPPPEPDVWSTAQYYSAEYGISTSANPGDVVCFTNTVTPSSSSNSNATGTTMCYSVYVNMQCSITTPNSVEPNTSFTISGNVSPTVGSQLSGIAGDGTITISINGNTFSTTPDSSGNWSITINNTNDIYAPYGNNKITGSFSSSNTYIGNANCNSSNLLVAAEPYIRVFGGDVAAGVDSASIESCFDTAAGIYSYNKVLPASNIDLGAGTTLADLATGNINQFVSGQSNSLYGSSLDPVTYSNQSGMYGGNFGAPSTSCGSADYYSIIKTLPTAHSCGPAIAAGGLTLSAGQTFICYSNGNLKINGNIQYDLSSVNSPQQIPVVLVVVKGGNITINSSNVSRLDGTFIAEKNGSNTGTIYDTNNKRVDKPNPIDNVQNTSLGDKLTINGALIANQIDFYRENGTLSDNSTAVTAPPDQYAAEEIDYSPLVWLAPVGNQSPQSILSLPPVY